MPKRTRQPVHFEKQQNEETSISLTSDKYNELLRELLLPTLQYCTEADPAVNINRPLILLRRNTARSQTNKQPRTESEYIDLVEPRIVENIGAALVHDTRTRYGSGEPPRSAQSRGRDPGKVPHPSALEKHGSRSPGEQPDGEIREEDGRESEAQLRIFTPTPLVRHDSQRDCRTNERRSMPELD